MAWNEPGGNNGKDPWGGKKNQSPPDLDEALRKLRQKFASIFGGSKSGSGGGSASGGVFGLGLIGVAAFVVWVLSGIFIVGPAERGVILRFGQYSETATPGLHWIPRGIDTKYIVDVERISSFSYTAEMLNKDENIVSVSIAVQYRISNLRDYLFNVTQPEESIQQAMASSLRQVVGHTTLDSILTTGREQVRQEVSVLLRDLINSYGLGIEVTDVSMQPARAPEQVKAAFDDAIKAQEDEQRFVNQAQAYAAQVEPIARGKAQRILEEAEAYKEQVILQAQGDVARFKALLVQYTLAPEVTRERLYIDAMQSVLSHSSKILVDIKDGNNLLYLPVDRIMQQGSENVKAKPSEDDSSIYQNSPGALPMELTNGPLSQLSGRAGRDSYTGRGGY